MTDFKDDHAMPKPARLSPQDEHFDFDLSEMRVLPDQDIQPSPLDHIADNEDIAVKQQAKTVANRFAGDEVLLPPTPEIKTSFYVDYFDKRKKSKSKKVLPPMTDTEKTVPMTAETTAALQETLATANVSHVTPEPEPIVIPQEPVQAVKTESIHFGMNQEPENSSEPSFINGSGMAVAVLSQFKSKQESINKQQEKLIQDFSKKISSATRITYLSLLFGFAALALAVKLGLTLFQTENKLSDLEKTNATLKDDLRNFKATPLGDEGTDPSLDQITQKIDNVEEQLSDMAELQNKVALLEKNTLALAKQTATLSASKPEAVAVAVATPAPVPAPVEATDTEAKNSAAKPSNVSKPAPVSEKPTAKPVTPAKTEAASKPVAAAKPETGKSNTSNKKEDIINKAIDIPANDINKVTAERTERAEHSKPSPTPAKPNQNTSGSSWTVNLASSNRLEDAKRAAEVFQQKGIPVTLSSVTVKNETRYRLQVKGFKNKEEATAYANKAKAALNLNSIWINP